MARCVRCHEFSTGNLYKPRCWGNGCFGVICDFCLDVTGKCKKCGGFQCTDNCDYGLFCPVCISQRKRICKDCCEDVQWCDHCGRAFHVDRDNDNNPIKPACYDDCDRLVCKECRSDSYSCDKCNKYTCNSAYCQYELICEICLENSGTTVCTECCGKCRVCDYCCKQYHVNGEQNLQLDSDDNICIVCLRTELPQ